jgi:ferredoxin
MDPGLGLTDAEAAATMSILDAIANAPSDGDSTLMIVDDVSTVWMANMLKKLSIILGSLGQLILSAGYLQWISMAALCHGSISCSCCRVYCRKQNSPVQSFMKPARRNSLPPSRRNLFPVGASESGTVVLCPPVQ